MKTKDHQTIAGALQLVTSLMSLPLGIMYVILYIRDIQEGTHTFGFQMALIFALIIFAGICALCFGIALLMKKRWVARVPGFLCCAPSLFTPIPLLFGVYTIWVLVRIRKDGSREPSAEKTIRSANMVQK